MAPAETSTINYSATEVAELMKSPAQKGARLWLLDVRGEAEREICTITTTPNSSELHIPMHEIEERFGEIPKEETVVVYCHTGRRSATVVHFLRQQGYDKVFNLRGGVDAWADEVEPNMARY